MEKPIITTDVPGCRDVINHGETGILVPLRNSLSIKHALILLIKNPDFAKMLGKRARQKAKLSFEISLINKRTISIYNQLFDKFIHDNYSSKKESLR